VTWTKLRVFVIHIPVKKGHVMSFGKNNSIKFIGKVCLIYSAADPQWLTFQEADKVPGFADNRVNSRMVNGLAGIGNK
jgi:hypothetical protein